MKKSTIKSLFWAGLCIAAMQLTGCKKKEAPAPAPETTTVTAPEPAPVTISPDAELTDNVKDAIKDFPTVTAAVADGEITLTGSVSRDRLPVLIGSLQQLHPKKVVNNLTINK